MKKTVGFIEAMHKTDGTPRGTGDKGTMCWGSGFRVTLSESTEITAGNTAIIARCPNPECQATNLVVVRVTTVIE